MLHRPSFLFLAYPGKLYIAGGISPFFPCGMWKSVDRFQRCTSWPELFSFWFALCPPLTHWPLEEDHNRSSSLRWRKEEQLFPSVPCLSPLKDYKSRSRLPNFFFLICPFFCLPPKSSGRRQEEDSKQKQREETVLARQWSHKAS